MLKREFSNRSMRGETRRRLTPIAAGSVLERGGRWFRKFLPAGCVLHRRTQTFGRAPTDSLHGAGLFMPNGEISSVKLFGA